MGRSGRKHERSGPSHRQLRVGEELRHALARILARRELREPALQETAVTVSEVRISPDLRSATAFVMPLGGAHAPEIMAALSRGTPFLRSLMAREVPLRHVPNLRFALDTSFDHASRIEALLHSPDVERDIPQQGDGGAEDGA